MPGIPVTPARTTAPPHERVRRARSVWSSLLLVVGLTIVSTVSAAGVAQAKAAPFDEPRAPGSATVSGQSGWDGWATAAATVAGSLLLLGFFLAAGTLLRRSARRRPVPMA